MKQPLLPWRRRKKKEEEEEEEEEEGEEEEEEENEERPLLPVDIRWRSEMESGRFSGRFFF